MNKGVKQACELYIECITDFNKSTIKDFIETSERVNKDIWCSQTVTLKMMLLRFSGNKELLVYLIGNKASGDPAYTEEVFNRLSQNLNDSDFSDILTRRIIGDFRDIWLFTNNLNVNCNSFNRLIAAIQGNTSKYLELEKLKGLNKYLYDMQDYYIHIESKEEYEGEIIKLIYKRSTIKFHYLHFTEQCNAFLTYSKRRPNLSLATFIELNKKLSCNMIVYSPEAQNTANRDKMQKRILLLAVIVSTVVNSLNRLQENEFPSLAINQKFECVQGSFNCLIEFNNKILNLSNSWMQSLESLYRENFWLTFLNVQEFWIIYSYIRKNKCNERTRLLLKFMDKDCTKHVDSKWMKIFSTKYREIDHSEVVNKLKLIGNFLQELPNIPAKKYDFSTILHSKGNKVRIKNNSVLLLETRKVIDGLISIYLTYCDELPRPYQVLYCKDSTTWRELSSFLYRWYTSDQSKLYTIIECENLTDELKNKFSGLFIELFTRSSELETIKPFAIITENSASDICSLIKHDLKFEIVEITEKQILSDSELGEIVKLVSPNMHVYTSRIPGLGKTTRIKQLAKENEMEYLEMPISGEINYSSFGGTLSMIPCFKRCVLHMDISITNNCKYLNEIIGSLIIFRMIFTKKGNFCLSEDSLICIEVADKKWLSTSSVPCLQLLNVIHLDIINLKELEYNEKTNKIGKYLHLYNEGIIDQQGFQASNMHVTTNQIKKAITDYLISNFEQVHFNYHRLTIFSNFLFKMLENFECGSSQLSKYTDFEKDLANDEFIEIRNSLRNIRKTIVENLLITAKEFSRPNTHNHAYTDQESNLGVAKEFEAGHHFMLFFSLTGKMIAICRDLISVPDNIKVLVTCLKFDLQADADRLGLKSFFLWLVAPNTSRLNQLKILLNNKDHLITDYSALNSNEILEELVKITDSNLEKALRIKNASFAKYVLTANSLINMALIYSRLISNIPIVFIGEAGCGKTSLVKFFVEVVLQESLLWFSVTAGTDLSDVTEILSRAIATAEKMQNKRVWVFFDEFNRSDYNMHISQIIYEKKFENKSLPENIAIIASCNTVDIRMSEKIMEYAWDFCALNKRDFALYTHSMISQLRLDTAKSYRIVMLTEFANDYFKFNVVGRSVGLRDVSRYIELFKWFNYIRKLRRENITAKLNNINLSNTVDESKCMILAFWHCYALRISSKSERELFLDSLSRLVKINTIEILEIISEEQHYYMESLSLKEETAENEALKEDIFAILPLIMNKTPIFIDRQAFNRIAAVRYLISRLSAGNSRNEFLKGLPAVKIFTLKKCSSSIDAIEKIFANAERWYKESEKSKANILPIIAIEDIDGDKFLACNSLKAFHYYLDDENRKFAFITVTKCMPDNLIMSRAIYLKDTDS